MFPRRLRLGLRPQLTIIVMLAAVLTTVATLFIANLTISDYVLKQAETQEKENIRIATLVLQEQYGQNVSISSDGKMVADLPTAGRDSALNTGNNFGRFSLNDNTDFVDSVQQLIGGGRQVSVYQCVDATGSPGSTCSRIETTLRTRAGPNQVAGRSLKAALTTNIFKSLGLNSQNAQADKMVLGPDQVDGAAYYSAYSPIANPDGKVIGVLSISVPYDTITTLQTQTTVLLVIIGTIIMVGGVILALIFGNTIIGTLQRAARQVSGASERIGGIAAQQASGSAQQVWAINAINQALQNFSETARDISQRTDQLALMGNQVLQRRQEISPTQIDSILAYITRSVRDISVSSRQQAAQYERMTGAMQAVIEIAEQVAGNSQQSTESAERLDLVVRQLQQLVGVRLRGRRMANDAMAAFGSVPDISAGGAGSAFRGGTIRAVRPSARGVGAPAMASAMGNNSGRMQIAGGMMGRGSPGTNPGNYMGGMPSAQSSGGYPNFSGMPGMGGAPGGQMRFGPPSSSGGMMRGPASGGMGGGMMGGDAYDWRLPPMPEMPPLPNWGGPQVPQSQRGQVDRDGRGAPYGGNSVPPGRGPGRSGGISQGVPGPNSDPYAPGPNNGGWPRNRGE